LAGWKGTKIFGVFVDRWQWHLRSSFATGRLWLVGVGLEMWPRMRILVWMGSLMTMMMTMMTMMMMMSCV
jgi:hypothetical protein